VKQDQWLEHSVDQLILRARAGAVVRFLLWDAPVLGLPDELRRAAADGGDRFQVLEEANPTRRPLLGEAWRITNEILGRFQIGSFHQKIVVVDGRVGFCGGMNIKENDWDTRAHLVFEPRRCAFARPAQVRAAVEGRAARPEHPPRHDFMARVEGPAAAHLEENFRERWNRLAAEEPGAAASGAAQATPAPAPEPQPPAGTSQVQVVRTMPEPWRERGILDVYLRAIRAARRLIYIEDQYFRSTYVSDAIADAVLASPELAVIVLAAEMQANELITGGWSHECFARIQRRLPGFELYTLRVSARDHEGRIVLQDVDNHAKLLVVDDLFLMVGSCNVNDRGFEFEGEINVAVADAGVARQVRLDLWREHLGGDPRLQGEIAADVAIWREHADRNRGYDPDTAEDLPAGNVFPFAPRTRRWMLVGPHVV
jgi:phosphatidylserine/phosphatidylglycerophosphate/cardiolipin synthase-like enzyme